MFLDPMTSKYFFKLNYKEYKIRVKSSIPLLQEKFVDKKGAYDKNFNFENEKKSWKLQVLSLQNNI